MKIIKYKDVDQMGLLYTADGNVKWNSQFGKQFDSFLHHSVYTYQVTLLFHS